MSNTIKCGHNYEECIAGIVERILELSAIDRKNINQLARPLQQYTLDLIRLLDADKKIPKDTSLAVQGALGLVIETPFQDDGWIPNHVFPVRVCGMFLSSVHNHVLSPSKQRLQSKNFHE